MSRYPAMDRWEHEVRAGVGGQRRDDPTTWRLDETWRAACREAAQRDDDHRAAEVARIRARDEARPLRAAKKPRARRAKAPKAIPEWQRALDRFTAQSTV